MKKWEMAYARMTAEFQDHMDQLVLENREDKETEGFGEWVPCSEDDPNSLPSESDNYTCKGTALCNGKLIEFVADVECARHIENWKGSWGEADEGQEVFDEEYEVVPHWEDDFLEKQYGWKDVRITAWKQWEPDENDPYPTAKERTTVMLPGETVDLLKWGRDEYGAEFHNSNCSVRGSLAEVMADFNRVLSA